MEQRERLLTAQEVADHLGLKVGTLAHWRLGRRGPVFIRVGRKVMYDADDVYAWQDSQRTGGEAA